MLKNVGLTQGFQSEGRRRESKSEDVFFSPPLSSCLISRLACVVVNWFTMSRAVWLRVFLTPALIPLWIGRGQVQERSCRKQDTEVIIDFLVPNIQCQCVCVWLHVPVCMCGCSRLCSGTFCVVSSAPTLKFIVR